MVRISERTSEIRTHANCESGRDGVKGQDERQSTAPLTPPRPPRELARSFCLTAEEAVIHGAQFVVAGLASQRPRGGGRWVPTHRTMRPSDGWGTVRCGWSGIPKTAVRASVGSHPSDDEAVRWMGHSSLWLGWLPKDRGAEGGGVPPIGR